MIDGSHHVVGGRTGSPWEDIQLFGEITYIKAEEYRFAIGGITSCCLG